MEAWKDELYHHGIQGQKWGVRRYQNADGSLTAAGKKHVSQKANIKSSNDSAASSGGGGGGGAEEEEEEITDEDLPEEGDLDYIKKDVESSLRYQSGASMKRIMGSTDEDFDGYLEENGKWDVGTLSKKQKQAIKKAMIDAIDSHGKDTTNQIRGKKERLKRRRESFDTDMHRTADWRDDSVDNYKPKFEQEKEKKNLRQSAIDPSYIGSLGMTWFVNSDELAHHGILGQKWGVRRYQKKDGTLTVLGRARMYNDVVKYENEYTKTETGSRLGKDVLDKLDAASKNFEVDPNSKKQTKLEDEFEKSIRTYLHDQGKYIADHLLSDFGETSFADFMSTPKHSAMQSPIEDLVEQYAREFEEGHMS